MFYIVFSCWIYRLSCHIFVLPLAELVGCMYACKVTRLHNGKHREGRDYVVSIWVVRTTEEARVCGSTWVDRNRTERREIWINRANSLLYWHIFHPRKYGAAESKRVLWFHSFSLAEVCILMRDSIKKKRVFNYFFCSIKLLTNTAKTHVNAALKLFLFNVVWLVDKPIYSI